MKDKEVANPKAPEQNKDTAGIRLVLIAGAIGGFTSWVFGLVVRDPIAGGIWALPTAMVLGAFAAGISVYVLTNTDTSACARTIFFAVLCGFVWKPVCDAGKAFIQQTIQHEHDASVEASGSKALELATGLPATSPALQPTKLEEIHDLAVAALDALPQVNSPKTRQDVEAKVASALKFVGEVAPQHPQVASRVIQSVGETAARNQSPKVANEAAASLENLASTNRAFALSHLQLKTNILNTVSTRYRLRSAITPP